MKFQDLENRPTLPNPPALTATAATTSGIKHLLIWYNHYTDVKLWVVNQTDISVSDDELKSIPYNGYFLQWCSEWTLDPSKVLGYIKVAADSTFLVDYNNNWATPYGLPSLSQQMLNTLDNERWYVAQIQAPAHTTAPSTGA